MSASINACSTTDQRLLAQEVKLHDVSTKVDAMMALLTQIAQQQQQPRSAASSPVGGRRGGTRLTRHRRQFSSQSAHSLDAMRGAAAGGHRADDASDGSSDDDDDEDDDDGDTTTDSNQSTTRKSSVRFRRKRDPLATTVLNHMKATALRQIDEERQFYLGRREYGDEDDSGGHGAEARGAGHQAVRPSAVRFGDAVVLTAADVEGDDVEAGAQHRRSTVAPAAPLPPPPPSLAAPFGGMLGDRLKKSSSAADLAVMTATADGTLVSSAAAVLPKHSQKNTDFIINHNNSAPPLLRDGLPTSTTSSSQQQQQKASGGGGILGALQQSISHLREHAIRHTGSGGNIAGKEDGNGTDSDYGSRDSNRSSSTRLMAPLHPAAAALRSPPQKPLSSPALGFSRSWLDDGGAPAVSQRSFGHHRNATPASTPMMGPDGTLHHHGDGAGPYACASPSSSARRWPTTALCTRHFWDRVWAWLCTFPTLEDRHLVVIMLDLIYVMGTTVVSVIVLSLVAARVFERAPLPQATWNHEATAAISFQVFFFVWMFSRLFVRVRVSEWTVLDTVPEIAREYRLGGWLWFDILVTIPWGVPYYAGAVDGEVFGLISCIHFARWVRCFYLNRSTHPLTPSTLGFRLVVIGCGIATFIHGLSVLFPIADRRVVGSLTYLDSLYYIVATMASVGYGDITPDTQSGRAYAVFVIISGIMFVSYFTASLTKYLNTSDEWHDELEGKRKMLRKMLNHYEVPWSVQKQMMLRVPEVHQAQKNEGFLETMGMFPSTVLDKVKLYVIAKSLHYSVPLFQAEAVRVLEGAAAEGDYSYGQGGPSSSYSFARFSGFPTGGGDAGTRDSASTFVGGGNPTNAMGGGGSSSRRFYTDRKTTSDEARLRKVAEKSLIHMPEPKSLLHALRWRWFTRHSDTFIPDTFKTKEFPVVLELAARMKVHYKGATDVVFDCGDIGREMFFIISGTVELSTHTDTARAPRGRRGHPQHHGAAAGAATNGGDDADDVHDHRYKQSRPLKAMQFFGETALLEETVRCARAKCVTACELYSLHQRDVWEVAQSFPWLVDRLEAEAERVALRTRENPLYALAHAAVTTAAGLAKNAAVRRLMRRQHTGEKAHRDAREANGLHRSNRRSGDAAPQDCTGAPNTLSALCSPSGNTEHHQLIAESLSRSAPIFSSLVVGGGGGGGGSSSSHFASQQCNPPSSSLHMSAAQHNQREQQERDAAVADGAVAPRQLAGALGGDAAVLIIAEQRRAAMAAHNDLCCVNLSDNDDDDGDSVLLHRGDGDVPRLVHSDGRQHQQQPQQAHTFNGDGFFQGTRTAKEVLERAVPHEVIVDIPLSAFYR